MHGIQINMFNMHDMQNMQENMQENTQENTQNNM